MQRIIDAVDETFIWAVLDRPPIARWTYGRITMLGDACHPMMPFMGQGGAQAIEDGAAITACLLKCGDDVEAALKLYEAVRMPRATQIQNSSWANKTRFHMPDGPDQVERDALMAKGMTDWSYRRWPGFTATTPRCWTAAPKPPKSAVIDGKTAADYKQPTGGGNPRRRWIFVTNLLLDRFRSAFMANTTSAQSRPPDCPPHRNQQGAPVARAQRPSRG